MFKDKIVLENKILAYFSANKSKHSFNIFYILNANRRLEKVKNFYISCMQVKQQNSGKKQCCTGCFPKKFQTWVVELPRNCQKIAKVTNVWWKIAFSPMASQGYLWTSNVLSGPHWFQGKTYQKNN